MTRHSYEDGREGNERFGDVAELIELLVVRSAEWCRRSRNHVNYYGFWSCFLMISFVAADVKIESKPGGHPGTGRLSAVLTLKDIHSDPRLNLWPLAALRKAAWRKKVELLEKVDAECPLKHFLWSTSMNWECKQTNSSTGRGCLHPHSTNSRNSH